MSRKPAFTLIEMLVVISLIVLLIALTMPNLSRAKENGRRVRCSSDMRQALIAITTLADGANGVLPSGKRNDVGGYRAEHCIWISDDMYDAIYNMVGTDKLFECINFRRGFGYHNQYGWVIGYNYLGNHPRMNELDNFESPIRISDDPSLAVWVDLNNYTPGGWVFAAHMANGALDQGGAPAYYNFALAGTPPPLVGAEGGNVGLLDTSVRWKPMYDMQEYETGEFGKGAYPCFW